jgi:hypothetical protein
LIYLPRSIPTQKGGVTEEIRKPNWSYRGAADPSMLPC